jgi:acylphosphatase
MPAFRYLVSGRVQGVGFRYHALRAAEQIGVSGFARNLPDGRVEVVAEGSDAVLAQFEEALRRGPSFGHVEDIERTAVPGRGDQGFHIR